LSRDVTIVLKVDNQFSTPIQQFKDEIGKVDESAGKLSGAAQRTGGALDKMTTAVSGAIIAFGTNKLADIVGDMFDLGTKTNIASSTFDSLTKNLGGSATNMRSLRDATGGTVDNLTLMEGTNKLLQMGLASNTDEMSKLAEMAIKLGSSMGMDATKSMSDFSLLLANNSIMRLDQFGISSGEVRQRIIELQAATDGLSRSDAFKMAVMEIGAKALDRLGTAASAAETPIARLQANVSNLAQDFSGRFTTGANAVAGILEIATGSYPGQAENQAAAADLARNQAADFARSYFDAMETYIDMSGANKASDKFVSTLMFTTAEAVKNNPNLDVRKFIADRVAEGWQNGEAIGPQDIQGYIDSFTATFQLANDEIAVNVSNQQAVVKQQLLTNYLTGDSGRDFSPGVNVAKQMLDAYLSSGGGDDRADSRRQQAQAQAIAKQRNDIFNLLNSSMTGAFGSMGYDTTVTDPGMFSQKLDPKYMKSLVPQYMQQSGADQITADLRTAQNEFEKLQALADQKLISDQQLQGAKNMVDNLSQMADQAQRAADNYKNLTLAGALGQSGGGMQGEMSDQIISEMKKNGASDKEIAMMQQSLDLASGRETQSSLEMKNVIVPKIAKMTSEKAAIAVANVDAFLKEAVLRGMSPEAIAAMMPSVITGGGKDGKNTFNLAGQMDNFLTGQTMGTSSGSKMFGDVAGNDEGLTGSGKGGGKGNTKLVTTVIADDMARINKDSGGVDKNLQSTTDNLKEASTYADAMKKSMDTMKTVQTLTFKFTADDPSGILGIVKAMMGGSSLADVVKSNGGSVPGQSSAGRATRDRG